MSAVAALRCVSEPVSWLRLERYFLGELAETERCRIEAHLGECRVCRECLEEIQRGAVELPALPVPPARVPFWRWAFPASGLVAAAAVAVVVVAGRPGNLVAPGYVGIKGTGELAIALQREHAGTLEAEPAGFSPGDRFKVLVTCAPGTRPDLEVVVVQDGALSFPLAHAPVECGNRVALPGAFSLSGGEARVCLVPVGARPGMTAVPAGAPCARVRPVPLDAPAEDE